MKTTIEMAKECDLIAGNAEHGIYLMALERFAELVRLDEREVCAKVIESHGPTLANGAMLAEAIRVRGNT